MPAPLSCLALVTEAFGGKGGIAQFNRDFLRALERSGVLENLVILPRLGAGATPLDYPRLRQEKSRFSRLGYSLGALYATFVQRPDIIISGHLYHGPLASRIAAMRRARQVSVLHGTEIWKPISQRHLAPLKRSDLVICVSEDTRNRYIDQAGGEYADQAIVLHNTVEDRFMSGDRRAARERFGLDEKKVILTVGRLDDRKGYKGHDRIFPVLARLKGQGQHVRYMIAGDGPDRRRLERLVSAAGLCDLVTFLGYVPDEVLPDLYRAADVFALPSTGEGFGIVFLEAMACGTPAIGLNIGGAADALSKFGQATSESEFEDALITLITNSALDSDWLSAGVRREYGRLEFERRVKSLAAELNWQRQSSSHSSHV